MPMRMTLKLSEKGLGASDDRLGHPRQPCTLNSIGARRPSLLQTTQKNDALAIHRHSNREVADPY
jgi:hypothetical protein